MPLGAGVASALGFLVAPPATDMVRSYVARLERLDWDHVNALFAEMAEAGRALLVEAGADPAAHHPAADRRYAPCRPGLRDSGAAARRLTLAAADLAAIREAFFASYRERFGRVVEDSPIEALSWRLACVAPGQDIRLRLGGTAAAGQWPAGAAAAKGRYVRGPRARCLAPVYDRYALAPGTSFDGPGAGRGARIDLLHRPRRAASASISSSIW